MRTLGVPLIICPVACLEFALDIIKLSQEAIEFCIKNNYYLSKIITKKRVMGAYLSPISPLVKTSLIISQWYAEYNNIMRYFYEFVFTESTFERAICIYISTYNFFFLIISCFFIYFLINYNIIYYSFNSQQQQ